MGTGFLVVGEHLDISGYVSGCSSCYSGVSKISRDKKLGSIDDDNDHFCFASTM